MDLTDKLKSIAFAGILGLVSIYNSGCQTADNDRPLIGGGTFVENERATITHDNRYPQQVESSVALNYEPSKVDQFMDKLSKKVLFGGGLFSANAQLERNKGNYDEAARWDGVATIAQNQHEENVAIEAAREGRSQVNVNVNYPDNAPRPRTQQNFEGLRFGNWVDFNGNNNIEDNEKINPMYDGDFRKNSIIVIRLQVDKYANKPYILKIRNEEGDVLLDKKGHMSTPIQYYGQGIYGNPEIIDVREFRGNDNNGNSVPLAGVHKFYVEFYNDDSTIPKDSKEIKIDFDKSF